jgi:hypothetical protein
VEPRYNGLEHEEDVCAQRRLSALLARVAELARQRLADIMIDVGTYPTICARTDGASRKSKPQSDRLLVPEPALKRRITTKRTQSSRKDNVVSRRQSA